MSYRGVFWIVMLACCLAFWFFVIESVTRLAKWAGF